MEYQALYRKYRPKNLDEVSGQKVTLKILKNSIENNKIAHAYLFYGPRGTGKTSVAKILARVVNCEKEKDGIQCENCSMCKISSEKECVDIIEIDAASNNGVEEIRDLKSKVSFVPSELKYKVYIIDEVHMLSIGAFNALLKTLEEPPSYVIFILATTELRKVPSTIISRCQTLEFKRLSENEIVTKLEEISKKENIKITSEALAEIARCSNGGLRDSIGLLEKTSNYKNEELTVDDVRFVSNNISLEELENLIDLIKNNKIKDTITKIDEYNENGVDLSKIVSDLVLYETNKMIKEQKYEKDNCAIVNKLNELLSNIKVSEYPKIELETTLINIMIENGNRNNNEIKDDSKKIDDNVTVNKKEETQEIKIETDKEENNDSAKSIKEIRVGNTLSRANKQNISNIRKDWNKLDDLAFDKKYGNIARLLSSDIVPVAASDEYIILNSKMKGLSEEINNDLVNVEKIIEIVFNIKYKPICITESEWKKYIEEYKVNKSKFQYVEEKITTKKTLQEKAKELFED